MPVHGLKGAIGHTLGAAGALEAVLCVLVLGGDDLPPTAGHRRSREGSPLRVLSGAPHRPQRRVDVVLSTSAAFSGTDAALVLERA